jgi:inner membrane protein YidH
VSEGREPDARFTLANERTFLAWNRTALALVAGGLAALQFLDTGGRYFVAIPLVLLGGAVAFGSLRRWESVQRALREDEPLPESRLPLILAVGIGILALIGAAVVIAELL